MTFGLKTVFEEKSDGGVYSKRTVTETFEGIDGLERLRECAIDALDVPYSTDTPGCGSEKRIPTPGTEDEIRRNFAEWGMEDDHFIAQEAVRSKEAFETYSEIMKRAAAMKDGETHTVRMASLTVEVSAHAAGDRRSEEGRVRTA